MATAFVRFSQSIAGALSLSHYRTRPLFRNSIRRSNCSRNIHSLFSSLDCSPSTGFLEELHCRVNVRQPLLQKFQRGLECSASSRGDLGGSAFYSTSAAVEEASGGSSFPCDLLQCVCPKIIQCFICDTMVYVMHFSYFFRTDVLLEFVDYIKTK